MSLLDTAAEGSGLSLAAVNASGYGIGKPLACIARQVNLMAGPLQLRTHLLTMLVQQGE